MKDFKDEDWEKLEIESAEFALSESEKVLGETIETARILTDRSLNIFQFCIPLLIGLVGLIFTEKVETLLRHLSVISLVMTLLISWKCLKVYKLYLVMPPGNSPVNVLNKKLLEYEAKQKKVMIISALFTTQNSIEFNTNENVKRQSKIDSIIKLVEWGTAMVIVYSILWYPVFQSLFE